MKKQQLIKKASLVRRKKSIRKNISGTASVPRISVFRSNNHILAQAIDDENHVTLASASDKKIAKGTKVEKANLVGEEIGKLLIKSKIEKAVFDRGGYKYHGRVKSLAEGVRSAGIKM